MRSSRIILPDELAAQLAAGEAAPALVIGMSIQGLAVARALATNGIEVHALEQQRQAPATRTRYATVHLADGINSDRLVDVLLSVRPALPGSKPIVLFPGSDNMVRAIANGWDSLAPHYALSWHTCRSTVLQLLHKDNLEPICLEKGIDYPKSVVLKDRSEISGAVDRLRYPLLVKPVKPLSSFKTSQIFDENELRALVDRFGSALPFLVQEWIEGDETTLHFCTMFLHRGEILCHFTGRKVRSKPRGLGMGTVVESFDNEEVWELSRQFVAGLDLSGPVAIEFKQDPQGRYRLIEPNVGRTEYSVDLLIQNGVNLPLIEYCAVQGIPFDQSRSVLRPVMWFDTERDPFAYLQLAAEYRSFRPKGKHPIFPYFGHADPAPFLYALAGRLSRARQGVIARAQRLLGLFNSGGRVERHAAFSELPAAARALLDTRQEENLFFGGRWFENYELEVGRHEGTVEWYCIFSPDDRLLAVWPFVRLTNHGGAILKAMSNYYTPYITLPYDAEGDSDLQVLRTALARIVRGADHVQITQVAPNDRLHHLLEPGLGPLTVRLLRECFTINWFQPIPRLQDYWESRDHKLQNTLKRKSRKLTRDSSWSVTIYKTPDGLDKATNDYFQVYNRSWKNREPYPDFIRNLIKLSAEEGWLRLGILYIEGQAAAAQIWLVQRDTAFIYKLAYDDQFAGSSAGTILAAHMINHVVSHDDVAKVDYLTGDDMYKRSWMDHHRQLESIWLVDLLHWRGAMFYIKRRLAALWDWLATPAIRDGVPR